jgi:DNA-binding transcriptional MerR regulator
VPSGYREYTSETIRLVRFIRRAQSLGFTLAEVEELIRLREKAWAGSSPAVLRDATDSKMREIDRRVRELRALRGGLQDSSSRAMRRARPEDAQRRRWNARWCRRWRPAARSAVRCMLLLGRVLTSV